MLNNIQLGKTDSLSRRYDARQHGIEQSSINPAALRVYGALRDAGYEAYLVGGCVRDLLLGLEPKDFDVSTNALPEEVHRLFRRSRIVGRRFRIVHVRDGRDIIEVSTFRGHHSPEFESESELEADPAASMVCPESGVLLRDNVFGSIEEDALRRDFTINALYYDPDTESVIDFCGGVADLDHRLLRVIGAPALRYREDPVRMLRAVRLSAKLDFAIERSASEAIEGCARLLGQVSPARLFDETIKIFLNGNGERSLELLYTNGLFPQMFPATHAAIRRAPDTHELVRCALRNSDARLACGKTVTSAFLFAALLWPALRARLAASAQTRGESEFAILHEAIPATLREQNSTITIPRRFATPMREIWELQHRLVARRNPQRLLSHPRFRAAYDFLLLREQSGEQLNGAGEWWTRYQGGDSGIATSPPTERRTRRRRRTRKSGENRVS